MTLRSAVRYDAGTACALVKDGVVVLLPQGAAPELVDDLWARLGTESGVIEVIQVLTGSFGSSLRTIPPFAVLVVSGRRVQVAVRGQLSVTLELADHQLEVDGVDVTTWSERVVEDVEEISVHLAGSEPVAAPGALTDLPIGSGVVLASRVVWQLVEERSGSTGAGTGAGIAAELGAPLPATSLSSDLLSSAPVSVDPPPVVPVPADPLSVPPSGLALPTPSGLPEETIAPAGIDGSTVLPPALDPPAADLPADLPAQEPSVAGSAASDEALESTQLSVVDDGGYGHLWGSTVLRTVEDAAVRLDEEGEEEHEAPAPGPAEPAQEPAGASATGPDSAPEDPEIIRPAAAPLADVSVGGMISGIPREWTGDTAGSAPAEPVPGPDSATPVPSPDSTGLDSTGPDAVDDHDGHTIFSSAIAGLRAAAGSSAESVTDPVPGPVPTPGTVQTPGPVPGPPPVPAPPSPNDPGPAEPRPTDPAPAGPSFAALPGRQEILARCCVQGHPNPPSRDTCGICGGGLELDARLVARPPLGRVTFSNGQVIDLDRSVVVGRRPRSPRAQSTDLPRLVTVSSPEQDISRSHVEIQLEGWHVLVSDLNTTNGTTLLRPGQPARRLHPSEAVMVATDDVVDLGDGVTLTFEGIL